MKIEVHIPVSVIVDVDTGKLEIGEIGSEAWPHTACPEIWNIERDEWEDRRDWPSVSDAAYEFLEKALAPYHQ